MGVTALPSTISQAGGGTQGQYNTAVGSAALNANTTGQGNTAVGRNALNTNTTGLYNTALGQAAMRDNTIGQYNMAVGKDALRSNTTGNYNVAAGPGALLVNTTGTNNTVLGYQVANATLTTGSNNILIGTSSAVDTAAAGTNYNLNIGNLLQGDMTNSTALGTEALFLQSTASSVDYLQIAGGATGTPGVVTVSAQGSDTDVNIALTPKGGGFVNTNAHMETHGNAPTITTCGTSPSASGNDNTFTISVGTGTVTACTVNFAHYWQNIPACNVIPSYSANVYIFSSSNTAITFKMSASGGGQFLYVNCRGWN